jgi:hypothetical protein
MLMIEMPSDDAEGLEEFARTHPDSVTIARAKRFDGLSDLVQALVVLSPATLPFVSKMVVEKIRSRSKVVVKYRGMELRGLTDATVLEVFKDLLAMENQARLEPADDQTGSGGNP